MELYQLYNGASMAFALFGLRGYRVLMLGAIVGVSIWVLFFILQGLGLYKMAKNRAMHKKWLVFVPFANIWYIGKLAGDCNVFGQRVKRAGLYTMLAQIATTLVCALAVAMEIYLYAVAGEPNFHEETGIVYWSNLTGFGLTADKIYTISGYILPIFQLVYEIFMLVLLFGLYKKYYPKNYMFLGILSLFIPMSRYIVIFVLRNRKAIDYEKYMQARREAYMLPAHVLHGAWGTADVRAGRDAGGGGRAGAVGGVRGARMLQVHGAQRRGVQGLLHGLCLRGRVRGRLPLLSRRRRVGGEHRGGHALRGAHHQRTRAASAVRQ